MQTAYKVFGQVLDFGGTPVSMARVVATNTSSGTMYEALSTEGGYYDFIDIPLGTYVIKAYSSGYTPTTTTGASGIFVTDANQEEEVNITLTPTMPYYKSGSANDILVQADTERQFTDVTPGYPWTKIKEFTIVGLGKVAVEAELKKYTSTLSGMSVYSRGEFIGNVETTSTTWIKKTINDVPLYGETVISVYGYSNGSNPGKIRNVRVIGAKSTSVNTVLLD